jgi:hypothetical protein
MVDSRWRMIRDHDINGADAWMLQYLYQPPQRGAEPTWEDEVPLPDEEAEQIIHAILSALPPERRERAIRRAARDAGLQVLTTREATVARTYLRDAYEFIQSRPRAAWSESQAEVAAVYELLREENRQVEEVPADAN